MVQNTVGGSFQDISDQDVAIWKDISAFYLGDEHLTDYSLEKLNFQAMTDIITDFHVRIRF